MVLSHEKSHGNNEIDRLKIALSQKIGFMSNPIRKKSFLSKCIIRIVPHDRSPMSKIYVGIIETFPLFRALEMRGQLREDHFRKKPSQKIFLISRHENSDELPFTFTAR